MIPTINVRGFVLAGGASRRFGRDKALVEFDGEPLIARLCRALQSATGAPVRIIGDAEKYSPARRRMRPRPLARRRSPRRNHHGVDGKQRERRSGLSELMEPDRRLRHAVPDRRVAAYLAERAGASTAEIVVPKSNYGLEPLCASWRASSLPVLTQVFEGGVRRVTDAMQNISMEVLDATDWKRFDNNDRLFWNMNTPADYEEAIRMRAERP